MGINKRNIVFDIKPRVFKEYAFKNNQYISFLWLQKRLEK